MDEQVIPEIDANRIAAGAAGATAVSQAVSAGDNVYEDFMKANAYLDEAKAPTSNRFAFVTPQMYVAIKSIYVRNITDAGVKFEQVDMDRFLGEYTPMVTLDVMKKLEDAEKREMYMQAYQMLIADPTNDLTKIKEYILPKVLPDINPAQEKNN